MVEGGGGFYFVVSFSVSVVEAAAKDESQREYTVKQSHNLIARLDASTNIANPQHSSISRDVYEACLCFQTRSWQTRWMHWISQL